MSYGLNSLKGVIEGIIWGSSTVVIFVFMDLGFRVKRIMETVLSLGSGLMDLSMVRARGALWSSGWRVTKITESEGVADMGIKSLSPKP